MNARPLASRFSLVLGATLLAGCAAGSEDLDEAALGEIHQPIKGGYEDVEDTAVVGIYDNGSGGLCSGSLLAPNMVLTARHCVSATLNQVQGGVVCGQTTVGSLRPAKNFYVTTQPKFTNNGAHYHAVREVIGLPVTTKEFCGHDQAILILEDSIAPEEAIPMVPRVDEELIAEEEYYAVGYGATNDSGSGAGTRRRRDNLFIECVAGECPSYYVRTTEWLGDTGICNGDSGGPAVDMANRVIGVTSRGAQGCDLPVYGYVFGWAEWIKQTAMHAAELGGYPPPAWALGAPTHPAYTAPIGGGCDESCETGLCYNGYCTRECTDLGPCPSGFDCKDATEESPGICVKKPPKTSTKKSEGGDAEELSSCALRQGPTDPTNPIPWAVGLAALGLTRLTRRAVRRRS